MRLGNQLRLKTYYHEALIQPLLSLWFLPSVQLHSLKGLGTFLITVRYTRILKMDEIILGDEDGLRLTSKPASWPSSARRVDTVFLPLMSHCISLLKTVFPPSQYTQVRVLWT